MGWNKTNRRARVLYRIVLAVAVIGLFLPLLLLPHPLRAIEAPTPTGCAPGDQACEALRKEVEAARQAQPTTEAYDPARVKCSVTDFPCAILKVLNWIVDSVSEIPFQAGKLFFSTMLAYNFGTFSLAEAQYRVLADVTRVGWSIVLGVVNMFFVLWLLWIAIATIFDFEPYTARQLLVKLIIAALLINFSFPISTAVVRLGNGIGQIFLEAIERRGGIENATRTIFNQQYVIKTLLDQTATTEEEAKNILAGRTVTVPAFFGAASVTLNADECHNIIAKHRERAPLALLKNVAATSAIYPLCQELLAKEDVARAVNRVYPEDVATRLMAIAFVVKLFLTPLALFVIFAAGIFLLIRLISLMLLIIFGPLAFLSLAIPGIPGPAGWGAWWGKLFQWTFYLPAFLFLFMLSVMIIQGIGPVTAKVIAGNDLSSLPEFAITVTYLIGLALMVASLMVANQMGIYGASTVTGWGKKLGVTTRKWAAGKGWKYAGKTTGALVGRVPGARYLMRVPGVRQAMVATMARGTKVEEKEIGFYHKLPDRQLATSVRGMRPGLRRTILQSLPNKRKRRSPIRELLQEMGIEIPRRRPEELEEDIEELGGRLGEVEARPTGGGGAGGAGG